LFPRATVTRFPKLGGWKQQKFHFSQLWRPKVQNQDVSHAVSDSLRGGPFLALSRFWCSLACEYLSVARVRPSYPVCPHILFPLCGSFCVFFLLRTSIMSHQGTSIWPQSNSITSSILYLQIRSHSEILRLELSGGHNSTCNKSWENPAWVRRQGDPTPQQVIGKLWNLTYTHFTGAHRVTWSIPLR
jgi:hypothetical protein